MEMLFTKSMKIVRNAGQKSVAAATDRNLAQEENQGRSQAAEEGRSRAMAGVRNRENGQNREEDQSLGATAVTDAVRKNGEEETRR